MSRSFAASGIHRPNLCSDRARRAQSFGNGRARAAAGFGAPDGLHADLAIREADFGPVRASGLDLLPAGAQLRQGYTRKS